MSPAITQFVGFAAAICTSAAYLPQVIRVWKTRRTQDVSLGMFLVMTVGLLCWLTYGVLIQDVPIILCNGLALVMTTIILVFKLKHG
jgi:MtN3 and saliva related transmembrane protein